ncbi:hypothetical protein TBLA_0G00810 [Henningerozyma blattae CBS 6284]|uniref:Phosphoribosylaminoimidazole-succinocarboxamide synthase n=1 Tax=Henningerozyma blattae (strain ATCC 34711 / CBS 6284 / DSM 70876 / NBRC 10599 / NRRL Y-10934 / UCD 77-7) TaxID=1071380 RepID=I2H6M6_HENB6|nr:hypothetical protein TBLA_0G00810 [Tetrapisispora blattae CBS 6284]CCH62028.1 hypothetical protein TBLA_0G00810 [Tetrapisispora blattae CBS 6284]
MAIVQTDLQGALPLVARGKVRDIYQIDNETLLFVATDRISAYDVIMNNPIPDKGILLTKLSLFWFEFLKDVIPNHLKKIQNIDFADGQLSPYKSQLQDRSLLVQKCKLIPLECIVRGYLTGSAYQEYLKTQTVHGMPIEKGLQQSAKFNKPIFTPSTKAEQGEHDENISLERAIEIIGNKSLVEKISKISIELYERARDYAYTKGIIIADTKFEFGLDENSNLILIDEVLTPDSSRFWSRDTYQLGKDQDSYDKQFLRNWLVENKLKGVPDVTVPDEIISQTRAKYIEAYESLTDEKY